MQRPISTDEHSGSKARPNFLTVIVVAQFCLIFACVLPVYQLREACRHIRQDSQHIQAADNPDKTRAVAVFGHSGQSHDATACGRCLILAVTSIFVVHQLLKFNQRCNTLANAFSMPNHRGRDPNGASAK